MTSPPPARPSPRTLFAQHELRWTKQREDVYGALAASEAHPTAEELYRHVQGAGGISLATVYNTLEALVRCGLARRMAGGSAAVGGAGAFRYDAEMTDHAHLVGNDGRIHDLPGDLGERVVASIPREVVDEIESRLGVRIARLSVEFVESIRTAPAVRPAR